MKLEILNFTTNDMDKFFTWLKQNNQDFRVHYKTETTFDVIAFPTPPPPKPGVPVATSRTPCGGCGKKTK